MYFVQNSLHLFSLIALVADVQDVNFNDNYIIAGVPEHIKTFSQVKPPWWVLRDEVV